MNSKSIPNNLVENVFGKFPEKRMEPFLKEAAGDQAKALELYSWNVQVAAAAMEQIAYAEVLLRTAIDSSLQEYSNEKDCRIPWFLRKEFVTGKTLANLEEVRARVARDNKETRDQIVAALSFGFWSSFLKSDYEDLWRKALYKAFPNSNGQRKEISSLLEQIRKFRNRVAHHDSLLSVDVEFELDAISSLAETIDPDVATWIRQQDRGRAIVGEVPIKRVDTVVVPAREAWGVYQDSGVYLCQLNRSFRPVTHMAFYADKEVKTEVPKIKRRIDSVKVTASEAAKLRENADDEAKALAKSIERALNAGVKPGQYQMFILTCPSEVKKGGHVTLTSGFQNDKRVAFVQKQRYTTVHKLRNRTDIWEL